MDCVFCGIVSKKLVANIYQENDYCMAIVPKEIEIDGHLLIITKQHYSNIIDIPEHILSETLIFTKNICNELKINKKFDGFNILNANGIAAQQSIQHFHLHILPRYINDNIDAWPSLPRGKNIYNINKENHGDTK